MKTRKQILEGFHDKFLADLVDIDLATRQIKDKKDHEVILKRKKKPRWEKLKECLEKMN